MLLHPVVALHKNRLILRTLEVQVLGFLAVLQYVVKLKHHDKILLVFTFSFAFCELFFFVVCFFLIYICYGHYL